MDFVRHLDEILGPLAEEATAGAGLAQLPPVRDRFLGAFREFHREQLEHLYQLHQSGASGRTIVNQHARLVDTIISRLAGLLQLEGGEMGAAIVATGGYGRGELHPHSDIDLLMVYRRRLGKATQQALEGILYFLWDMGFQVGHSVRSIGECVAMARKDTITKTALMESRWLAGSESVFREYLAAVQREVVARKAKAFVQEKLQNAQERHTKYGDSVYLREPHVKEGEGGLRDFQTALWIARVNLHVQGLDELEARGVLRPRDRQALEGALDFLWRVRNELHYLCQRRNDVLTLELQETIAKNWNYPETPPFSPLERFMRDYYQHAKTIRTISRKIIARSIGPHGRPSWIPFFRHRRLEDVFCLYGRSLYVNAKDPQVFREKPLRLLKAFALAQRMGANLSENTLDLIVDAREAMDETVRRSPEARKIFFQILKGPRIHETLGVMHATGILGRYLPEFGALEYLVQHNPYHKYTVDEHTLMAIRNLEALHQPRSPSLRHLGRVLSEVNRPEILFLATLLHDMGKTYGAEHMDEALVQLPITLDRLGVTGREAERVHFLVANHMLMSHLGQRREVTDTKLLAHFAATVEDMENLRKLYLLTYADIAAVGPEVWSEWKGALLQEFYFRTAAILEGAPAVDLAGAREAAIQASGQRFGRDVVERFLDRMPAAYLSQTPAEEIPVHLDAVSRLEKERLVITHRQRPERGVTELTVCTYDALGLFAKTVGTLAAHNLNILGARIFTSRDGVVLDTIQVTDTNGRPVAEERFWESVHASLRHVLTGVRTVESLWSQSAIKLRKKDQTVGGVVTKVVFDNESSDACTLIEVFAHDRIGLLYRIADALLSEKVNTVSARICTELTQVIDVFYVTDLFKHKITHPERLKRIESVLLEAIATSHLMPSHPSRVVPS